VRRLEILVLRGKPVAHLVVLWYVMVRGKRMASLPVYQAGDAQSIFGRMTVKMRWQAMWIGMPLPWWCRKRSAPNAVFPPEAAERVCCLKFRDSSMCMPRYLMLQLEAIDWSLIMRGWWVERSFFLSRLVFGRQWRSSVLGGEK
jgi:hypothetical protein